MASVRVELLASPYSSFFEYFTLDDDVLGILDGDYVLADDLVLVDISSYVRRLTVRRGRQRDIDEMTPGVCTIEFNDRDGTFNPVNTASILAGNVEPMRQVYVTAVVDGVDYPLFRGFAQEWTVNYDDDALPLAGVAASDALVILANQELDTIVADHSGDLSGDRVERVLDLPEVEFPAELRSIATGDTVFGDTTFGTNAHRYLQLCAQSEGGVLFVSKTGVLTFEARSTGPGVNQCTFSDDPDDEKIGYSSVDLPISVDLLYNRVKTSGTSEAVQTVSDADSIAAYMVRTLDRTGQLALNDADMLGQAQYLLGRFRTPEMRLRQVTVPVHGLSEDRQAEILGLELTDRVTVERTPPSCDPIVQAALVDGLEWQLNGPSLVAIVTMSTGAPVVGFILDDDDFGLLDGDAPLSY